MRQADSLRAGEGASRADAIEVAADASQTLTPGARWIDRLSESGRAAPVAAALARYGPPLPLAVVLCVYAIAAAVIPVFAPVSISDDWTYVRSVEILYRTGELEVLPVAAAAVVFQALWAGLFTLVFGLSFGAIRLATVVLTGLSGLAFYGLCRELGIDQRRSALGAGVYLFNPLAFVLGYTFMSDPYFAALLTIALYFYARGLRPECPRPRATLAGSVVAACAFLVRVHGLGLPLGATIYLLVTGRLSRDRAGAFLLLRVWAIPAAVAFWYWGIFARGLPEQQGLFLDEAKEAWFDEAWLLAQRLTYLELVYAGFFVLPLMLAAVVALPRVVRFRWGWAWGLVGAWALVLGLGLRHFADPDVHFLSPDRRLMPYIPHFFGRQGLGARDVRGYLPAIAPEWAWQVLTGLCVGASLLLAIVLARRVGWGSPRGGGVAGLVLVCGLIQAGGPLPQSLLFRNWVISLDRYLLPLLPFAVALTLWGLKDVRLRLSIAWVAVALMAAYAIAGTRDELVFLRNAWNMARYANDLGIPNDRLDAGYSWDAYHLWEYSYENGIPPQSPPGTGTWWTDVYAPATDSAYVVAMGPSLDEGTDLLPGYVVIAYVEYSSWLQTEPTYLYLLRRNDVPLPPNYPVPAPDPPPSGTAP